MDKAIFISELRDVFSNLNKKEKRYSKVWLSDENFGGLYHSGKYILNVKASHHLKEYSPEIRFIIDLLDEKLDREKVSYIFNLEIYNENEEVRPDSDDIILYNDEVSYKAA
jgi:hypothetical protein